MERHLYIIGNGFDLYHGINSSYRNFRDWLYENEPTVIQDIEEAYGCCDDEWWSDFENQLGSLDILEYASAVANEPGEDLTRVEALEMVIATMHFFPTNVYNDMFEDVIGHERYAGAVECAWQNGLIPENMVEDRRFCPRKKITGEEFYRILKNGYKSRRTWTDACEKILPEGFLTEQTITRSVAAKICRSIL